MYLVEFLSATLTVLNMNNIKYNRKVQLSTFRYVAANFKFSAVTFLEYWKRKSASLAHHWDCMGFQVIGFCGIARYLIEFYVRIHINQQWDCMGFQVSLGGVRR